MKYLYMTVGLSLSAYGIFYNDTLAYIVGAPLVLMSVVSFVR